jgi:hypothetical protein
MIGDPATRYREIRACCARCAFAKLGMKLEAATAEPYFQHEGPARQCAEAPCWMKC